MTLSYEPETRFDSSAQELLDSLNSLILREARQVATRRPSDYTVGIFFGYFSRLGEAAGTCTMAGTWDVFLAGDTDSCCDFRNSCVFRYNSELRREQWRK
jgi:hypothetical protein